MVFSTIDSKKDLALNLDAGEVSGALTVYVNALVKRPDGQTLGVAGLGLDVSDIIRLTFYLYRKKSKWINHSNWG